MSLAKEKLIFDIMERYDIINLLIEKYQFKTYLEIGVRNPSDCFDKIRCEKKDGVDPGIESEENEVSYPFFSDTFFEMLNKEKLDKPRNFKWDIIFIDGLHISSQVERDVLNSLEHLSEEGIILLHDCNPPTIGHAREDYGGGEWNGTVWKSLYKLRCTREDLFICTVDTDWGVGIIKRGTQVCCQFNNSFYEFREFERNKKESLNLVSIEEFKNIFSI